MRVSEEFYRPAEVDLLIGNPQKARDTLGWSPRVSFAELVQLMVEADMKGLSE
jgi:GDPmannose 4,6-dehydratase